MIDKRLIFLILVAIAISTIGCDSTDSTNLPNFDSQVTSSPSPNISSTPSPGPSATANPSNSNPSPTISPSSTPSSTPSATPSPSPTVNPSVTPSPTSTPTPTPVPIPENATNFNITPYDYYSVSLNWTAVSNGSFVGYRYSYQPGSVAPADCNSGTSVGNTTHVGLGNLNSGTQYIFRLCSYSGVTNPSGQFSSGVTATITTPSRIVATAITTGTSHTCALSDQGNVHCWGYNTDGELGSNSTSAQNPSTKVLGLGGAGVLSNIQAVSAGYTHTCALSNSGNVYCWGKNMYGELGHGSTTDSHVPIAVTGAGGSGIVAISVGINMTCSLSSSGNVYCWGHNSYGQLGNNSRTDSSTPVEVVGPLGSGYLSNITAISANTNRVCALSSSGNVYCWGSNDYGRNTNSDWDTVPTVITNNGGMTNLSNIAAIAVGDTHNGSVSSGGNVYCWGDNRVGETGLGRSYFAGFNPPGEVVGVGGSGFLSGIVGLAAGYESTCAVNSLGALYCWGDNSYGQLGTGNTSQANTPVLSQFSNAQSVSMGQQFTCALTTQGRIYCTGRNLFGQLGDLTYTQQNSPVGVYGFY